MYLDTGLVVGALTVIAFLVAMVYRTLEKRVDREFKQIREDLSERQKISEGRHHRNRTEQMALHEFDKQLQRTLEYLIDEDHGRVGREVEVLKAMAKTKGGVILDEEAETRR